MIALHLCMIKSKVINWFSGCTAYNLGTGRGTSVLEMVSAFEKASGKVIVYLSDIHVHFMHSSTKKKME